MRKERGISTVARLIIAIIVIGVLVGVGVYYVTNPPEPANALEIYTWWTAGGEKEALNALIDVFSKKYPDVTVIHTPVSFGGAVAMAAVVKSLMAAGRAPDAFQVINGYNFLPYAKEGLLEPVNDLWEELELEKVYPKYLCDSSKYKGDYYVIPLNVHRINLMWYNKSIFAEHGLEPPTTWDELISVCDTLKAKGITPIALGNRGKWVTPMLFEQILASTPQIYEDFINGNVTADQLKPALRKVDEYLKYVNPDYDALDWDEACGRVYSGEAAMVQMGDWAKGYFTALGWKYGVEFGSFKVPGTEDKYVAASDCFQRPKGAAHPKNSDKWLRVVASLEGQQAFNPIKGSIPPRLDAPKDPYDNFSRMCMDDFKTALRMPNFAAGLPESVGIGLLEITSEFTVTRDIDATATAIVDLIETEKEDFELTWDIV